MSTQNGQPIREAVRTLASCVMRSDTRRLRERPISIAMAPHIIPGKRICIFAGVSSLPNIFRITR